MGDTPPPALHGGKGLSGFLSQSTAGLPNWAWILVVAAGVSAAIFLPKFLNGGNTGQSAADANSPGGLGFAVDPTSGLPYAVSGLVPSGAQAGGTNTPPPAPTPSPPAPNPAAPQPSNLINRYTRSAWSGETGLNEIPLWQNPNANWQQSTGSIPLNQQIQVGAPVTGNYYGKTATYYPVEYQGKKGYIGSWDLAALGGMKNIGSTGPMVIWPGSLTRSRHYRSAS